MVQEKRKCQSNEQPKETQLWGIKNIPCSPDAGHETQRRKHRGDSSLLQSLPTKGLFPIQSTRSLDNAHRDLKAKQWGWDHWTKHAPPSWSMQTGIQLRSIVVLKVAHSAEKLTSVSLSCLTESWHHNTPFPSPPPNKLKSRPHLFPPFPLKEIHVLKLIRVELLLL